jgi:hypothetical protein
MLFQTKQSFFSDFEIAAPDVVERNFPNFRGRFSKKKTSESAQASKASVAIRKVGNEDMMKENFP